MRMELLPTPRHATWGKDKVALGSASSLVLTPKAGQGLHATFKDWLKTGSGSAPVRVEHDPELMPEHCSIEVSTSGVRLCAADERGWLHGLARLRQITNRGMLQVCRIDDGPALALRGYHINFSIKTLQFENAMSLLESMRRWRLNTVLIEYNDRFPYARHPALSASDSLESGQIDEMIAYAKKLNIEVIPLHQCLGHVESILAQAPYSGLREEDEHRDQFCPLNPGSLALFKELADDFLERHPGARYFHIGGDETRRLGVCPACAAEASRAGEGGLYAKYVIRAAAHLLKRGVTPVIWDDMLCKHAEIIPEIPREVIIMYWDYWTTQDPSALFVARPANLGVVADKYWQEEHLNELCETERRTLRHFTQSLDLAHELPGAFHDNFHEHLGPEYPRRIRAFPYIEYYQKMGFRVIGAAAGGSNTSMWHGLPDFPRYTENIRTFSRRLSEAGSMGIVTTAWYNVPYEALLPGLIATGQFSWNPQAGDQGGQ